MQKRGRSRPAHGYGRSKQGALVFFVVVVGIAEGEEVEGCRRSNDMPKQLQDCVSVVGVVGN